jgi:hypothetical protein
MAFVKQLVARALVVNRPPIVILAAEELVVLILEVRIEIDVLHAVPLKLIERYVRNVKGLSGARYFTCGLRGEH